MLSILSMLPILSMLSMLPILPMQCWQCCQCWQSYQCCQYGQCCQYCQCFLYCQCLQCCNANSFSYTVELISKKMVHLWMSGSPLRFKNVAVNVWKSIQCQCCNANAVCPWLMSFPMNGNGSDLTVTAKYQTTWQQWENLWQIREQKLCFFLPKNEHFFGVKLYRIVFLLYWLFLHILHP